MLLDDAQSAGADPESSFAVTCGRGDANAFWSRPTLLPEWPEEDLQLCTPQCRSHKDAFATTNQFDGTGGRYHSFMSLDNLDRIPWQFEPLPAANELRVQSQRHRMQ